MCHNLYQSQVPSGENDVVIDLIASLEALGHEVKPILVSSDVFVTRRFISKMFVYGQILIGINVKRRLRKEIVEFKPDIIHVHNQFPIIGMSAIKLGTQKRIPIVQTLHNYRLTCINGLHLRKGAICSLCISGKKLGYLNGIIYKCYRDSFFQSIIATIFYRAYRKNLSQINHFVTLSDFMKKKVLELGIPENKISIINTPYVPVQTTRNNSKRLKQVLFIGRLSREKGIKLLIDAWSQSTLKDQGWTLKIAGVGELFNEIEQQVSCEKSIFLLGKLNTNQLEALISVTSVVCLPSLCYEGFPRTISQSASLQVPLILNKVGSLETIGNSSWVVHADSNVDSWVRVLDSLSHDKLEEMGVHAYDWWAANASRLAVFSKLEVIYKNLLDLKEF